MLNCFARSTCRLSICRLIVRGTTFICTMIKSCKHAHCIPDRYGAALVHVYAASITHTFQNPMYISIFRGLRISANPYREGGREVGREEER